MLYGLIYAALILGIAPLVAGIIKTAKARLQNRRGASPLQPYYDLAKLFRKGSVVSPTTSWVFQIAPYIYFASSAAAAGMAAVGQFTSVADMLLLVYVYGLGRFFLALASLDAGSTFGGMGGSREMYISVLVEPALLLALLTVAGPAGTTSLAGMTGASASAPLAFSYIMAAIAFFVVIIAETGRIPVDNPDTHLELTMVHEGMVLEYSGRHLGLIHWASMMKQMTVLMLFVTFFIPWGVAGLPPAVGGLVFAVKLAGASILLALAETSTNKMRLFRLPGFLAVSCLLSLLALVAQ